MTRFIDPNSGAAPQPGGYAGPEGAEKGHGIPSDMPDGVEQQEQLNEAPELSEEKSVGEVAEAAQDSDDPNDGDNSGSPQQVLSDLDEGNSASTVEVGSEEEASDAKALEIEAVNLGAAEVEESYDPSEHNVDEVLTYVEANPDQKDVVLKAEVNGKNRKTVIDALS